MIQALGLEGLEAHAPDGYRRLHRIPADFQTGYSITYANKSHLQAKNGGHSHGTGGVLN
jgi:hypothetical protein